VSVRESDVLSRSTMPTGTRSTAPSFIKSKKNQLLANGTTTIIQKYTCRLTSETAPCLSDCLM